MSDPTTDAQLDEFLEIRKPGAHLDEGVVADDFVLMLGVDLVELPEVPAGRRRRHLPEGRPRHPPAARRRLRRRAPRLQRSVPRRPALHRLLEGGARRRSSCRGARRTCSSASTAGPPRSRSGTAPTTMAEIEWAAWNDQVVPELERMQRRVPPRRHRVRRPEPAGRRGGPADDARRLHRAVHARRRHRRALARPQLVTLVPREPRVPAAVHRGVGRADRRALRRSTRCSTSSGRCGATTVLPGREAAQGRVPRHHRQHGRGLDEGPPDRRDRAARARRSTSPSRCPSPTSAS